MKVSFEVEGEPKAKGRPRFTRKGYTFTPKDTVMYENLVRYSYREQCKGAVFPKDAMIEVKVLAYMSIPKSASKKKQLRMLSGELRPTKKPDTDNILKAIQDSLNGIAYHDDAQIVSSRIDKYYSERPRVEVFIKEASERWT